MDYRYKPGDRVVVAKGIEINADYFMHSGDAVFHPNQSGCMLTISDFTIKKRKQLEGQVVTISGYSRSRYLILETDNRTLWVDDLFDRFANDECYVESLL